jgi:hypothetical protein
MPPGNGIRRRDVAIQRDRGAVVGIQEVGIELVEDREAVDQDDLQPEHGGEPREGALQPVRAGRAGAEHTGEQTREHRQVHDEGQQLVVGDLGQAQPDEQAPGAGQRDERRDRPGAQQQPDRRRHQHEADIGTPPPVRGSGDGMDQGVDRPGSEKAHHAGIA